jgi:hypothetical protein
MVESHLDEQGIFGRIGPTTGNYDPDRKVKLDDFLSNQIEDIIDDQSIMAQIESEISRVTDETSNESSRSKNLKPHE